MFAEQVAVVGDVGAAGCIAVSERVDVRDVDEVVMHGLHDQYRRGGHRATQLGVAEDMGNFRRRQNVLKGFVEEVTHVPAGHPDHCVYRCHLRQLLQQLTSFVVGVLLDHPGQAGVAVLQRGHHQRGQTGKKSAIEPAERVTKVTDG
ncbi:Uncharacterised protein [Mycobacterium tuberculosis]|uniref:Uncharacterized protein n=1 Tax=Mycobacterium tuberculosis TaxID=1773 RepID=A0A655F0S0_MYCTX|nr:Uncharacterised protein [Mycobacterium tuberculosis]CNW18821.1 Uncharacterised protein [Mycobacterium tuberculosis]COW16691.1 Uncharacterised protein [Mycobacterium tuberculosis]COW34752.1 Uncharacterised protein [Mycobacterium tuberculosis]